MNQRISTAEYEQQISHVKQLPKLKKFCDTSIIIQNQAQNTAAVGNQRETPKLHESHLHS